MNSRLTMTSAHVKMAVSAVLLCIGAVTTTNALSTTLYGGGATLPAGAYFGWHFLPSNRLTLPADLASTSIFGAWAGTTNSVQYCQTGSGGGKRVLNGDTGGSPSLISGGTCGDFFSGTVSPATSPVGFQIPTTAVVQPDFVASDAPYSEAEYITFVTNKGATHGEPVQFPAIGGSIAVVYKNSDPAVPHKMNLTQAQVCGIFAGTITNWNVLNSAFHSKDIRVVYRSDDSGTSFNLSNYLSTVCGVQGDGHFQTFQTFYSTDPTNNTVIKLVPLNSSSTKIGASGDPGVVLTVEDSQNDGAIGYAEVADALDHSGSGVNPVDYATIGGKDPVADLPATLPVTVTFDKVILGADPATGMAVIGTQAPNTTARCLGIVDPNTYAVQPTANYPIVAVSYLVANQKGNSTDLTALRSFMNYPQNHPVTEPGFAQLTGTGISVAKAIVCLAP